VKAIITFGTQESQNGQILLIAHCGTAIGRPLRFVLKGLLLSVSFLILQRGSQSWEAFAREIKMKANNLILEDMLRNQIEVAENMSKPKVK
jgi:hypothetical protein